jgi:phosphoribosyl 1,2-cyclic phosphodiesterase
MRELMAAQLDGVHSPIALRNFAARVFFRNLSEEQFSVGDVKVSTVYLTHPGLSLGYRFDYRDKSFCYITDNELHLPGTPQFNQEFRDRLVGFVKGADILLTDATYTDEEYPKRVNWGHSAVGQVAALAHDAGVRELQLFHHDPDQSDDDIDRKLESAQAHLARLGSKTVCTAPAEGEIRRL